MKVTYLVRWTVNPLEKDKPEKSYKVEWVLVGAKDAENIGAIMNIPYTGALAGRS
ncbi:MAG: hypothetical protein ACKODX_07640 [Gemmata sp.]